MVCFSSLPYLCLFLAVPFWTCTTRAAEILFGNLALCGIGFDLSRIVSKRINLSPPEGEQSY